MSAPRSSTGSPARSRTVDPPPVRADRERRPDFERPVGRRRADPDHFAPLFDQVDDLGPHPEMERWIAAGVLGDEVEEVPLRHERDEPAMGRQVREVGDLDLDTADDAADASGLLVWPLEELIEQAKLVHVFQGRGVDRVAPEVAEKVGVLLQHDDVDPGPREQESQDHSGRASAGDAATGFERFP